MLWSGISCEVLWPATPPRLFTALSTEHLRSVRWYRWKLLSFYLTARARVVR